MPKSKKNNGRGSSTAGKAKGANCQKSVLKTWYSKDTKAYRKNPTDWLSACIEVSNMKGNLPTQEVIAHREGRYFN